MRKKVENDKRLNVDESFIVLSKCALIIDIFSFIFLSLSITKKCPQSKQNRLKHLN